ncbi:glyoxalase superfamily protein [Streptomyces sp. NPDC048506]|uniref:glyoxalase superfamily protein n=1 Tax=Streptomyces sp. NPDC048506 TaxID=3155028 RepID=UPI00341885A7
MVADRGPAAASGTDAGDAGSARDAGSAQGAAGNVVFRRAVPVLRIFDVAKAHEFYVDYLGCTVDWEHRYEPGMPLYTQVSRGNLVLHLSEHHGDATPGSTLHTELTGVRELHAELAAKDYPYLRPGLEHDEIGTCLTLLDPFGNRLRFNEPGPGGDASSARCDG